MYMAIIVRGPLIHVYRNSGHNNRAICLGFTLCVAVELLYKYGHSWDSWKLANILISEVPSF